MKEIVKNQFNNHLLVEMVFYNYSPAFLHMIENCNIHLLVEMIFVYEFLQVIVPVFMDFFNDFCICVLFYFF